MSAVAERIAALAQEELGLVVSGRWHELAELHARRDEALAAMPDHVTAEDRPVLERALELQRQVEGLIERARAETSAELGRLDRGRTAARGYALSAGRPLTTLKRG